MQSPNESDHHAMSYVARDNKITPETIEVAAASNPDAIALARSGKKEVLTVHPLETSNFSDKIN